MKPAGRDVIGNNPSAFSAQAAHDQDVRGNPNADENRHSLHPTPSVTVVNHGQTGWSPAPFFPPQLGHSTPVVGPTGVGQGVDMHRTASQPMLREPEATNSAQGSGNREVDATSSDRAAGSSDRSAAEAASDRNYRSELAAWVNSEEPGIRAIHQAVERTIHAYLEAPEKQAWTLDLVNANIRILPPLPVSLSILYVSNTDLIALPANLPEGLQKLYVSSTDLSTLPANLPQGLQELDVSYTKLSALPANLPEGLQKLDVSYTILSALPANLPEGLQELDVSKTDLVALPANLPEGLQKLNVRDTKLSALPANLPEGLQKLDVSHTKLSALPANLPEGLQELDVSSTDLSALPANLPQGLQKLAVRHIKLSALPANLPHGLQELDVRFSNISLAALLTIMQTNTSITELYHSCDDPVLEQGIKQELLNNSQHDARLANAAVSFDLLTRLAFTTSDQTGELIHRPAMPHPVAGRLPEQAIPAELHDVLAANTAKSLLAVLAGMVDGASQ